MARKRIKPRRTWPTDPRTRVIPDKREAVREREAEAECEDAFKAFEEKKRLDK